MKEFQDKVKGTCGLLMHKYSANAQGEQANNVKKKKQHVDDAMADAEDGALRMEDGRLMLPAEYFFQSMCAAAGGFQVKGQGKKTYRDAVKGNILIEPEYIPFEDDRKEFQIDSRPVRIQKSRVLRHRPLIPTGWPMRFKIVVTDDEAIPDEVLNAIVVSAGQTKAVGDYRPRFGRFMVEEFKRI